MKFVWNIVSYSLQLHIPTWVVRPPTEPSDPIMPFSKVDLLHQLAWHIER